MRSTVATAFVCLVLGVLALTFPNSLQAEDVSENEALPLLAALPTAFVEQELELAVSAAYSVDIKEQFESANDDFVLPDFKGVAISDLQTPEPLKQRPTSQVRTLIEPPTAVSPKPFPSQWQKETSSTKAAWSGWSEAELSSSETLAKLAVEERKKALPEKAKGPLQPQPAKLTKVVGNPVKPRPRIVNILKAPSAPKIGAPILVRIFKEEAQLELWMKTGQRYSLFKTYPICTFSGRLGPKLKTGDHQAPEGFYFVGRNQMNPYSQNHRAFNLGFPNLYDRSFGRTGSFLMVHGVVALSVVTQSLTRISVKFMRWPTLHWPRGKRRSKFKPSHSV
jgi:hypothetical protein